MKVGNFTKTEKWVCVPPIPFDRPDKKKPPTDKCVTFKLRSKPTVAASPTYELTVEIFKDGTAEDWILFTKNLEKVFVGQNFTAGADSYAMARRLLDDTPKKVFENKAREYPVETMENLRFCLQAVAAHVFPGKAPLADQKRYMRRMMRKSTMVSTRSFVARMNEMNDYLDAFPPFQVGQRLEEDVLLEILEFAIPGSWKKKMTEHGFVPTNHNQAEVIEFCERMEFAEGTSNLNGAKNSNGRPMAAPNLMSGKGPQWVPKTSEEAYKMKKKRKNTGKWCILHKTDSHDSGECKIILDQARKMRGQWETLANYAPYKKIKQEPKHDYKSTNDWKHKKKEELNTLVAEAVASHMKAASLKRKADKEAKEEDFNFEIVDLVDNLSLSEDDDDN
jgi:hypothetical protein